MTSPSRTVMKCDGGTRNRTVRIDYMPSQAALAAIDAKRATQYPNSIQATNRAVLDAIVTEWATFAGINKQEELVDSERSARAQDSGVSGINAGIAGARAGAFESGAKDAESGDRSPVRARAREFGEVARVTPPSARARMTSIAPAQRVICGATRHRDGQPCQAKSVPGKRRCRFHGGMSTGPKTIEGRARALSNLRQHRKKEPVEEFGSGGSIGGDRENDSSTSWRVR